MSDEITTRTTSEEKIHYSLTKELPPLYTTEQVGGVVVKRYLFINSHSKMNNNQFSAKDIEQNDYSLLSAYKSELENQLELNRKHCINYYDVIKVHISNWLKEKFGIRVYPFERTQKRRGQSPYLVRKINILLSNIYSGVETELILQNLTEPPTFIGNDPIFDKYGESWRRLVPELHDKIAGPLKDLERIVSSSVDLYFEYLNIHSCLYEFHPEEIFEKNKTEKRIEIFVRDKFDPKAHSKQMIEDYLKRWERNQGASYPRKVTVEELRKTYPKLAKIYDSSSGVIKNWEDKWIEFRNVRTENQ